MTELPTAFRVADKQRETGDTWTLRLEPADRRRTRCRFAPGQFAMLYAFGVGRGADLGQRHRRRRRGRPDCARRAGR